ncbi:MAG: glycosyltransferase [Candidatus Aminicenantes bacterium]|nr:glycosyltransferase [Candidatus Aminicenantes bacterium]
MEIKYSVILPTYNEKNNIGRLIDEIYTQLGLETEVIVVDDNSPDGTWQKVEEISCFYPGLKLIRRMKDHGLVASLREGIEKAKGEIIIWLDADGSMPATKIPELIQGLSQGYDLVAGSRFVPGGGVELITGSADSMTGFFLSFLLNRWCEFLLGRWFHDYTSGFVAIKKDVLKNLPLRGDYGEYFIALVYEAHRQGYRLLEIPYINRPRWEGQSKTGLNLFDYLKRGWKYFWLTLKLRFL